MRSVALALSAGVIAAACGGGGAAYSQAVRRVPGCPALRQTWTGEPRTFFPSALTGLRLRGNRCVYLVRLGSVDAQPLWRAPAGERVRGLGWAQDGRSLAVTTGAGVVILTRDASVLRRVRATGASFMQDGRIAVSRADGIFLLNGARLKRLASRDELEHAAGFRLHRGFSVSEDPWGYTRGQGRDAVAITVWSAGRTWKSVVLVISGAGRVTRASPAYRAGGGEGAVYGWAWSPDGRRLFVTSEVAPPVRDQRGDHDHCLDRWSRNRGRERAFCESQLPRAYQSHFAKVAWASDGTQALLDNGTIVERSGAVSGRLTVDHGPSWQVQWAPFRG